MELLVSASYISRFAETEDLFIIYMKNNWKC